MLPLRPFRRSIFVAFAIALALTAGCGGGSESEDEPDEARPADTRIGGGTRRSTPTTRKVVERKATTTSVVRLTVTPKVLAAFKAADAKQIAAFTAAEVTIRKGRGANDLAVSQTGGREARDAFFALDADLRKIDFPAKARPLTNAVLTSLGEAIALFDEQNVTKDQASFLALDSKVGKAVLAVRRDLATLRTGLGIAENSTTSTTDKSFFDRG